MSVKWKPREPKARRPKTMWRTALALLPHRCEGACGRVFWLERGVKRQVSRWVDASGEMWPMREEYVSYRWRCSDCGDPEVWP